MSQPVVLKSNPHGINLILDDRIPFQELLDEILHKFKESDKFFKNARIALSFEGRELSQEEELAIVDLISRNTSIDVVCILDNNSLRDEICARKIQEFDESQSGRTGEFYKGTLRSGQVIECKTSIVVLGDVNPGAKIIAKGKKFSLKHFSMYHGEWRTDDFYVGKSGNITIGSLKDGDKKVAELSFNMTGVNPI